MLSFLKSIFQITESEQAPAISEALIEAAIEKAIDGTDPRLRLVDGYARKMRPAVIAAISFVEDVAMAFAPPLDLSRHSFASDPQVHALFGSADDVPRIIFESREVRDFLASAGSAFHGPVYAGLRMSRTEKSVIAPDLRGDTLQSDMLRTIVNFSDHELVIPAASESALRQELKERIFVATVERALARLVSIKDHRAELEKRRSLLRMKLKRLQARGLGMQPFIGQDRPARESTQSLERQLEETEQELSQTVASLATLNEYLDQINDVLSHPGEHLTASRSSTRLTRMGFKTTIDADDPGDEIVFTEIAIGDSERLAGRLVVFDRDAR